ncbi:murein biosynthesis integral membrane protein MurJ [Amycolatopsis sp. cmx-11-12]|uniref:murein biosynthesis integral membrane protein MurJ n=1 Tax=Amycolatopsis sp. cmx-11-12 TaxID=2785795 RepID=UPI003916E323
MDRRRQRAAGRPDDETRRLRPPPNQAAPPQAPPNQAPPRKVPPPVVPPAQSTPPPPTRRQQVPPPQGQPLPQPSQNPPQNPPPRRPTAPQTPQALNQTPPPPHRGRRQPPPVRPWQQDPRDEPDATRFIPRTPGVPMGSRWPVADPDVLRPYDQLATQVMPAIKDAPLVKPRPGETGEQDVAAPAKAPSIAKSSGRMAIASLISRITGFAWKLLLVAAIGAKVENDSFNVANTMPNIIFELLMGGVLSSLVVPLLVRSQDDKDGGEAYTQRLVTVAGTLLVVGTAIAVFAAPLITKLYVDDKGQANPDLVTAFAYLLLPQIFFYGVFALLSAVLNAKNIFGPTAWAPVINNLVVVFTILVVWIMPGNIATDPVSITDPKLLTLGLGVTFGIVAQSILLIPPLLRSGFKFKWRWGIDKRMKEFGGLALWTVGYVAVSQVGYTITTRVLTSGSQGGVTAYANAWLLFQLPYGVIGVSLLTAIMPRMSRAAADGDHKKLIGDLSYASRISTVMLVPISAVMTVVGGSVGIALFSSVGKGTVEDAARMGEALAISAFALLPYALVMLQMRVFYAMKDARTPVLIMIVMTVVKVPLLYLCPALLSPDNIVLGVMMVNGLTFVVGAILGQVWLWVTLGNLRSKRILGVILFTVVASVLGVGAAWLAGQVVPDSFGPTFHAWVKLLLQTAVGIVVSFGVLMALKVEELKPATTRITRLIKRG